MATLTLRIDDATRDQLQEMAEGRGVSVSDLVRSTIDDLFDRGDRTDWRTAVVPESISAIDRKQLALLHRILARLVEEKTPDERLEEDGDTAYQLDRAAALEAGWAMEYDMEFYAMEPELSRRDCGLVMDLLDMFRVLKASLAEAGDAVSDETQAMLTFVGFDLNDERESRLLRYARSLVSDERWSEHLEVFSNKNDRGNSHHPTLGTYQRMLAAYEPIWSSIVHRRGRRPFVLTVDELQTVAEAAVHPSRRAGR